MYHENCHDIEIEICISNNTRNIIEKYKLILKNIFIKKNNVNPTIIKYSFIKLLYNIIVLRNK